jgi:hypothetical protein
MFCERSVCLLSVKSLSRGVVFCVLKLKKDFGFLDERMEIFL